MWRYFRVFGILGSLLLLQLACSSPTINYPFNTEFSSPTNQIDPLLVTHPQQQLTLQQKTILTDPPILQIDTGGHTAVIRDIMFTNDAKTGKTVRMIRRQIGEGDEGKIYVAALSPNNLWLALGGYWNASNNQRVRLLNFQTGEVQQLFQGHSMHGSNIWLPQILKLLPKFTLPSNPK